MMGWGVFGSLMMIFFWVALVWLTIWVVKEISGRSKNQHANALDILKERYAKGEISKSEFEAKKKDIIG